VLLVGRLLSGIATSLLFSVFEAWMIFEHNQRGFASQLLSRTFSLAVFGNGVAAIIAGVVASFVTIRWGFVSPFIVSLVFLVLSSVYVNYAWSENYGNSEIILSKMLSDSIEALKDRKVFILGTIQSLFEASMYVFVFMWTPVLEQTFSEMKQYENLGLHGLIFASFMVCVMVGGSAFRLLERKYSIEQIYAFTLALSSFLFLSIAIFKQQYVTYFAFLVFECCCGIHWVCISTLRSRYIPEESRSSVMNLFRVPLNVLVVAILLWIDSFSNESIFLMCSLWLAVGAGLQFYLSVLIASTPVIEIGS